MCKFYIFKREKGKKSGLEHWQGFLILKRSQRLKKVKEILNDEKAHVEVCKGTDEENITYVTKLDTKVGEPIEWGERPVSKQGTRSDIETFTKFVKEYDGPKIKYDEILEKFGGICAKYPKFVKEVTTQYKKRIIKERLQRTEMTEMHIIYGETKSGKTTYVKELKDAYWKNSTQWWDDYDGEEICIFNEWTLDSVYKPLELLKLCDHAPLKVQVKGNTVEFLAKQIWITTNLKPDDILSELGKEHKKAFMRRVKWYTMKEYKLCEEKVNV